MEERYDVILIGSGAGALTVASLMAQLRGKRVLVLERHFRAGGYTHAFQRGKFSWDVGIHYVGDLAPGSQLRKLFDLITAGEVEWNPMPDPFDVFHYPDVIFEHHAGRNRFVRELSSLFPREGAAIRAYAQDVYKAVNAFGLSVMGRNGSGVARGVARVARVFNRFDFDLTTKEYLDRTFRDPKLKAILASQWGDYGLPPSLSPFMVHAVIVRHYMDGAWYPSGGAGRIAAAVRKVLAAAGGKILLSREVREILIEKGQATGVRVRNGRGETEEFRAPLVVSNAGAANTYLKLLPDGYPLPLRNALRHFMEENPPTSHVSLYAGLKDDPRKLGFQGENHWLFSHYDHDLNYSRRAEWIGSGTPEEVYLSFPSLKDPEAKTYTAELISFTDYASFGRWRKQPWRNRDAGYQELKERIASGMLRFVEERFPGFTELVEFHELSTPLTNEFMTGHAQGAIYGLPPVPARFRKENHAWTDAKTPVPGLYLTGADVALFGVAGAVMGGLTTLSHLPGGISFPAAFAAAAKRS